MRDSKRFVASFAPSRSVLRLAGRADERGCAWTVKRAAALLVDVVGFSALADRLAGAGEEGEGADELARLMNLGFEFMIDAVAQHGGEIAELGGDSLLAVWAIEEPSQEAARCRAALACAQQLLDGIAGVPSVSGHHWRLHLGAGVGDVVTACIGGVGGRLEPLTAGPVLGELRRAFERASPGTGIVSPQLWSALEETDAGGETEPAGEGYRRLRGAARGPAPLLGTSAAPAAEPAARETVRSFLPLPVRGLLDARLPLSSWLAQIRTVTVLFLRLTDLDAGSPGGVEKLHGAVRALQERIYPLGGALNDVTADARGTTALAFFGLTPGPDAYEPHHALRAALDLTAHLRERVGAFGVGVATGKVFCGAIGNDRRRRYTVTGRAVNLAARLAEEAREEVLCDDASHHLAADRLAFESLSPLAARGFRDPVPRWRPRWREAEREAPVPPRRAGFFGRERELRAAANHLFEADESDSTGGSRILVLEGAAGVGKSRLTAELLARAETRGHRCVLTHADPTGRGAPYAVWRRTLSRLWPAGVLDALREAEIDPDWAPLLNPVSGLELPDTSATAALDASARAARTRALLLKLVGLAIRRTPQRVVLAIEDAYWLDAASWELALAVAGAGMPLALIVTLRHRTGPPIEALARLQRLPNGMTLVLDGLGSEATTALVEETLGVAKVPPEVAAWVFRASQGNPFYSRELCLALRDRGDLRIAKGAVQRAPDVVELERTPVPYSVEAVVTHRIDRLAPADQLLLKCASVIGPEFDAEALREVAGEIGRDRDLGAGLRLLAEADLVAEPDPFADGTRFRFKHDITWRVAYDLLPRSQRRRLHAAVASWYERAHADRIPLILSRLASHWQRAEDGPRAAAYLARAGEAALQAGAHPEAVRCLRDALAVEDLGLGAHEAAARRATWEQRLAVALWSLGDLRRAEVHAGRALQHVGFRPPRSRAGWGAALLRQLLAHGPSLARSGESDPRRLQVLRTGAAAALVHTDVHYFRADLLPLVACCLLSVNLSERMGDPAPAAKAYGVLGISAGIARQARLARFYFERARRACRERGDLVGLHSTLGAEAVWHVSFGRHTEAERVLDETLALCRKVGDPQNVELALTVRGLSDYNRGRFADSHESFAEIHRSTRDRANVQLEAWGLYAMGQNRLRMGGGAEALRLFERARELLSDQDDQHSQKICDGLIAQARLLLGDLGGARRAAEEAAARAVAANNFGSLEGHAGPVEVFAQLARLEASEAARRRALDRARREMRDLARYARLFPIGQPRLALCRGLVASAGGRAARARRRWREGVTRARRLEMPYEEARLHQCLGALAELGPEEASRHRERAMALADACGARLPELDPVRVDVAGSANAYRNGGSP